MPQRIEAPEKDTSRTETPPPADREASQLNSLPVELLMQVIGHLAPNDVQPYFDGISQPEFYDVDFNPYKQSQKTLRMLCLVSKQMDLVARPYLYRAAFVNHVDVLTYFLRTLDESPALGNHVKHLVLEVPFLSENKKYRKPDVSVLQSGSNFSEICEKAAQASNFTTYQRVLSEKRVLCSLFGMETFECTFEEWTEDKEKEVLNLMYYKTLSSTNNLESLCLGMLALNDKHCPTPQVDFLRSFRGALNPVEGITRAVPFMSKLKAIHLLGENSCYQGYYRAQFMRYFLAVPSLRTLKSSRDNSDWSRINSTFHEYEDSSELSPNFPTDSSSGKGWDTWPEPLVLIVDG
ncbi:hypothetical protein N8I77_000261 [Diaporthe amygdali]|uniref:F-box domain-containing protein n=1 Tax=Phomopsis amygdali TaxID=1214568 RepID=A0AAD9SLU7_PHOAM|nr:hypothetical protein N8I77_000261 [Diaporthe amygdali]